MKLAPCSSSLNASGSCRGRFTRPCSTVPRCIGFFSLITKPSAWGGQRPTRNCCNCFVTTQAYPAFRMSIRGVCTWSRGWNSLGIFLPQCAPLPHQKCCTPKNGSMCRLPEPRSPAESTVWTARPMGAFRSWTTRPARLDRKKMRTRACSFPSMPWLHMRSGDTAWADWHSIISKGTFWCPPGARSFNWRRRESGCAPWRVALRKGTSSLSLISTAIFVRFADYAPHAKSACRILLRILLRTQGRLQERWIDWRGRALNLPGKNLGDAFSVPFCFVLTLLMLLFLLCLFLGCHCSILPSIFHGKICNALLLQLFEVFS